jgi:hypothetical protein
VDAEQAMHAARLVWAEVIHEFRGSVARHAWLGSVGSLNQVQGRAEGESVPFSTHQDPAACGLPIDPEHVPQLELVLPQPGVGLGSAVAWPASLYCLPRLRRQLELLRALGRRQAHECDEVAELVPARVVLEAHGPLQLAAARSALEEFGGLLMFGVHLLIILCQGLQTYQQ